MQPRSPRKNNDLRADINPEDERRVRELKNKKRRRARRRWTALLVGGAVVVGGGVSLGVFAAGYLYASNPTIRNVVSAVVHRDMTPDRAFPGKDSETLVVIGADQDMNNYKQVTGTAQRSDTLMVARFDFLNQKVGIVSIPRDTKIQLPGYRGYQKINAAFARGGKELTKETVQNLLGVQVDHAAIVNFGGFKKLVDMIGGVPVDVDKPLHYDDNWGDLHVHLEPGHQWLNGDQALGYVRIRKVDDDLHRAARQQAFVQALKGRLADPRVWFRTSSLITQARESLKTDLDDNQLLCLAAFMKSLPKESVQTATLTGDEGPSFVTLDPNAVREVARSLLAVENAPLEGLGGRERIARRGTRDRSDWRRNRRSDTGDNLLNSAERDAWKEEASSESTASHSHSRSRRHESSSEDAASPADDIATAPAVRDDSPVAHSSAENDSSSAASKDSSSDKSDSHQNSGGASDSSSDSAPAEPPA
jgi:LCP family protein required for cell wall assembly